MDISHFNIGILHSLIGKNDGVSIVIDQTVRSMVKDLNVELGNIFFLAAHTSPRFNAETDEIFWHKNDIHKTIISYFSKEPPDWLDSMIHENALRVKNIISKFVEKHSIDLLIAHNTSHPYNFVTAVGLGYYFEELREKGIIWPKILVWWHDSYFEREQFSMPNKVINKYLKYLPGTYIDGIVLINSTQYELAKRLFSKYNSHVEDVFFRDRVVQIPNTCSINWNWKNNNWADKQLIYPPIDNYNKSFLKDIGILEIIESSGFDIQDTIFLLQHTRIVPRKKIEVAIDFAFEIEKRFWRDNKTKCIIILVSGHSGDEQFKYKEYLTDYYLMKKENLPQSNVALIFGEDRILSHRDIIVDKKYYSFSEIPSIIASYGGIGTYFSEVEGFGNNLLEMLAAGLPVVINRYEVYRTDIEPYGFDLPFIDDAILTDELIEKAYAVLNDITLRNKMVRHNLEILEDQFGHQIIARKLESLIINMFTKSLG
jgi:glycosyltransferase involved in cell wall biosynthesis